MIIALSIFGIILCCICLYFSYAFTRYKLVTERAKIRFMRFYEVISASVFAHVMYDILVAALMLGIVSLSELMFTGIRANLGYPAAIDAWYVTVKAIAGLLFMLIASVMVDKYIYTMHQRVYTALINSM